MAKKMLNMHLVNLLATVMLPECICINCAGNVAPPHAVIQAEDLDVVMYAIRRRLPEGKRQGYNRTNRQSQNIRLGVRLSDTERALLTQCTSLDLSNLDLRRLPMSVIALMSNLVELNVSNNSELEFGLEDIQYMSRTLGSVICKSTYLTEEQLRCILMIPSLTRLDISNNDMLVTFTDNELDTECIQERREWPAPQPWTKLLGSFRSLVARRPPQNIQGRAPLRFNKLRELKAINCNLDGSFMMKLTKMKNLRTLDLSGNISIGKSIPADLGLLKDTLTNLKLEYCDLSSESFKAICTCVNLEVLDVSSNWDIWDCKSTNLGDKLKTKLVELNMAGTNMDAHGLVQICEFTRLRKLDISDNYNVGEHIGPDFDFKRLKITLRDLNAARINLRPPGIKAVCTLERLEKLDISGIWTPWERITGNDFVKMSDTLRELTAQDCTIDSKLILDMQIVLYKANVILKSDQGASSSY